MVWKAKTSLAELLRRRKQTLQEWMLQMNLANLDEVSAWCVSNDAAFDVEVPKVPSKRAKDRLEQFKKSAEEAVAEHHDAGRSVVVFRDNAVVEIPPPPKKTKPKKEEGDPSSGTE